MSCYSEKRAHLRYYNECLNLIKKIQSQHNIQSVIDIGGQCGFFVSNTTIQNKTSLDEKPYEPYSKDIKIINEEFLTWDVNKKYDMAICMQTLEHIEDKDIINFTRKLFTLSSHLIISVPHKWEKGSCRYHHQDPIDKQKLFSWTGRKPDEYIIVKQHSGKRLIAYYK